MIEILSPAQLDRARVTGRLVGDILHTATVRLFERAQMIMEGES